ncbi:MAG TPA: aspartate 4-decarboxylase [Methylomusa anaerophila]|uniref:Aminotransferase n=1 Tax=Methylomusa anaerophila TaxID=1930071 RepID=A0A348AEH8_9FIRM|nr:aspartate 4-decarboxylase [Methylomusa anaerophila]BBB89476.1 bifunctional aspartate aminotransferase and L-aspartate beta-decarboxylase [Methylomusa anaerophila]HML89707.1 aspartate 4-decarboxylase [Methylomusa anaerophila]
MVEHNDDQHQKMNYSYRELSPFEFNNKLISLAEGQKKSTRVLLNAGRGNPNWIAATPREAFFVLGQFAVQESRQAWNAQDLAGQPRRKGIEGRFKTYCQNNEFTPGVKLLKDVIDYGITAHGFDAEEWIYELVDGIIGDNYPMPDRMLVHVEAIVHDFLIQEMCSRDSACERYDLFAVEGATAAMCYVFDSLYENYLLSRGDKIAIMVPIFPPYVEIPRLARYNFDVVEIKAKGVDNQGKHTWQYPPAEIDKLCDPSIKALFLVNPSNPPSVAIQPESIKQLIGIVKNHNPDLMIISDDVYGTFVDGYRSLMADLSFNTIGVYSFSKYFGVTGWRLGVVAVHQDNVFDQLIKQLPQERAKILQNRYSSLSQQPENVRFIDRMVADSRQVALNHTAGLSTPQQVQMMLLAAFALLDKGNRYKQQTKDICHRRIKLLYEGLGLPQPNLPYNADYYTQFDLEEWSNHNYGREFTDFLQRRYEPVDILFRLAQNSSIVLLHGGGFHGPTWSVRVSLANLDDDAYAKIGHELRKVLEQYVVEWKESEVSL